MSTLAIEAAPVRLALTAAPPRAIEAVPSLPAIESLDGWSARVREEIVRSQARVVVSLAEILTCAGASAIMTAESVVIEVVLAALADE